MHVFLTIILEGRRNVLNEEVPSETCFGGGCSFSGDGCHTCSAYGVGGAVMACGQGLGSGAYYKQKSSNCAGPATGNGDTLDAEEDKYFCTAPRYEGYGGGDRAGFGGARFFFSQISFTKSEMGSLGYQILRSGSILTTSKWGFASKARVAQERNDLASKVGPKADRSRFKPNETRSLAFASKVGGISL